MEGNDGVIERLDIKQEFLRRRLKYRQVCNAIHRNIGWLTSRLNGYVPMTTEDDALVAKGLEILSVEHVSSMPEDLRFKKEL